MTTHGYKRIDRWTRSESTGWTSDELLGADEQTSRWTYIGVDVNPLSIESCRRRFPDSRFEVVVEGRPLPFDDESVDIVIASGVLDISKSPEIFSRSFGEFPGDGLPSAGSVCGRLRQRPSTGRRCGMRGDTRGALFPRVQRERSRSDGRSGRAGDRLEGPVTHQPRMASSQRSRAASPFCVPPPKNVNVT